MKQHITEKQLEELTDTQKEYLRSWAITRAKAGDFWTVPNNGSYGGIILYDHNSPYETRTRNKVCYVDEGEVRTDRFQMTDEDHNGEYPLPMLSIGQMIEFLSSKEGDSLQIDIYNFEGKPKANGKILCDALWEDVKAVLSDS